MKQWGAQFLLQNSYVAQFCRFLAGGSYSCEHGDGDHGLCAAFRALRRREQKLICCNRGSYIGLVWIFLHRK